MRRRCCRRSRARPQIVAAALYDREWEAVREISSDEAGSRILPLVAGSRWLPDRRFEPDRATCRSCRATTPGSARCTWSRTARRSTIAEAIRGARACWSCSCLSSSPICSPPCCRDRSRARFWRWRNGKGDLAIVETTRFAPRRSATMKSGCSPMPSITCSSQIEEQNRAIRDSHERLNLALRASGVGTWIWHALQQPHQPRRIRESAVRLSSWRRSMPSTTCSSDSCIRTIVSVSSRRCAGLSSRRWQLREQLSRACGPMAPFATCLRARQAYHGADGTSRRD